MHDDDLISLMRYLNFRQPIFLMALASACFISGCSTSGNLTGTGDLGKSNKVAYSIVYVIHGDAGYLYHDSLGTARQADEEVLSEAIRVGEQAKNGEVLIFHQRPERKILWLFPKKDRRFLFYRGGKLISNKRYSPSLETGAGIFSAEARLFNDYGGAMDSNGNSIFLYFGHEIPYKNGKGYYRSLPGQAMTTDTFSAGINSMLPDSRQRFDLIVLSTCNNATPDMVHALKPFTGHLLASPQNLHLSHIDTEKLAMLENNPAAEPGQVADTLSLHTYRRLTKTVETVVSLSIFDMQEVDSYIHQVDSTYRSYLKTGSPADPGSENTDCINLSIFENQAIFAKGVKSRYRPPRFGRKADRKIHSGWGCKDRKP